ncbi:MAG: hypothetical protein HZC40_00775 [Chloroflexi bacterium]|nr:hypothetical protein [Chloroflexota bacterium]
MDDDRNTLNAAQLQRALTEAQRELATARGDLDNLRGLVIGIGQAFVPEALIGAAGDEPHAYKKLTTAPIAHLIINAATDKVRRLTAFADGLDVANRERVIQQILGSAASEWTKNPLVERLYAEVESERAARRAAEERARVAEAETQKTRAQMETTWRDHATAKTELGELRKQMDHLTQARAVAVPVETPAVATPTPSPVIAPPVAAFPIAKPVTAPARIISSSNGDDPLNAVGAEWREGARQLIVLLATRGVCERPRLARILATECGVGDGQPNHLRVNRAFEDAEKAALIEVVKPRSEIGMGRAPHLIRLSDAGRIAATRVLGVEPAPSELDRLLKAHDTPEHVVLILGTRDVFLEKYPEPIERVDIFPVAVGLEGDKRYEADVAVQLKSGAILYIECERATPKNRDQRRDKWGKYFKVTGGRFFIVTPDARAMSDISSEITEWHFQHRGNVSLRMTNLHDVLDAKPATFWKMEREMKEMKIG